MVLPASACFRSLCTRSDPFKLHSLPWGRLPSSRCIRSAPRDHATAHCCVLGAPDTALRHMRTNQELCRSTLQPERAACGCYGALRPHTPRETRSALEAEEVVTRFPIGPIG